MTPSTNLKFRAWRKPEVLFTVVDWQSQKGLLIVLDPKGDRLVMSFVLPGSRDPARRGFHPTFPVSPPVEVEECSVILPPCRTTPQEVASLRSAVEGSILAQPWERKWLKQRDTVLLPKPEDACRLKTRLAAFKIKMKRLYKARKAELEEWRTKKIGEMLARGDGRFYRWTGTNLVDRTIDFGREARSGRKPPQSNPAKMSEEVEKQLQMLEYTFNRPLGDHFGRPSAGLLNWTLEVARHERVICDQVLRRRWASELGTNLAAMNTEKVNFLRWYRAMFPRLHAMSPQQKEQADMVLCAEVRFRVRFADGSRIWLAEFPLRQPLLTPAEQGAAERPSTESLAFTSSAPASHLEVATKMADTANSAVPSETGARCDSHPFERVCQELHCKPVTLRSYCKNLEINPDSIGVADFAQIKEHRENLKHRPHLKKYHKARHGRSPRRKG